MTTSIVVALVAAATLYLAAALSAQRGMRKCSCEQHNANVSTKPRLVLWGANLLVGAAVSEFIMDHEDGNLLVRAVIVLSVFVALWLVQKLVWRLWRSRSR